MSWAAIAAGGGPGLCHGIYQYAKDADGYAFKVAPPQGVRICFTYPAQPIARRIGKRVAQWKQERKAK